MNPRTLAALSTLPPDQRSRALAAIAASLTPERVAERLEARAAETQGRRPTMTPTDLRTRLAAHRAAVALSLTHEYLTVHEAAQYLGVGVRWLRERISEGLVPCDEGRGDRCVEREGLVAYKARVDEAGERAMEELARLTQELGEDE